LIVCSQPSPKAEKSLARLFKGVLACWKAPVLVEDLDYKYGATRATQFFRGPAWRELSCSMSCTLELALPFYKRTK
jgi:hypothetical protein